MAYDASVDRIVAARDGRGGGSSPGMWLFDPRASTWARGGPWQPSEYADISWFRSGGGPVVYAESTARSVIVASGVALAYDAAADRWDLLYDDPDLTRLDFDPANVHRGGPTARSDHAAVYDPVNERLVLYGGTYYTLGSEPRLVRSDDVIAFDPATGEWTVLLEAVNVQPFPRE